MFELKLTFKTADDLYAAVAKLAGEAPAPVAVIQSPSAVVNAALSAIGQATENPDDIVAAAEAAKDKKKPGRPKKEAAPVVSAATGAAEQDPAPKPEGDAHLQTDAFKEEVVARGAVPTPEDVKAAAERVNAKVGIIRLRELLASFQAARISEVKEEDRAAFIAKADEVAA